MRAFRTVRQDEEEEEEEARRYGSFSRRVSRINASAQKLRDGAKPRTRRDVTSQNRGYRYLDSFVLLVSLSLPK